MEDGSVRVSVFSIALKNNVSSAGHVGNAHADDRVLLWRICMHQESNGVAGVQQREVFLRGTPEGQHGRTTAILTLNYGKGLTLTIHSRIPISGRWQVQVGLRMTVDVHYA